MLKTPTDPSQRKQSMVSYYVKGSFAAPLYQTDIAARFAQIAAQRSSSVNGKRNKKKKAEDQAKTKC